MFAAVPASVTSTLAALLTHLVILTAGVAASVRLREQMRASGVQNPPEWRLLLLFLSYGGWVLVFLTAVFWHWSGAATAGILYLILIAPWILAAVAFRTFRERRLSRYHWATFWAALCYCLGMMILVPLLWWAPRL